MQVRDGELPLVRSFFGLNFALICALTLSKATRDGLFLSEHPAQLIPYLNLGLAVITGLCAAILGLVTRRMPDQVAMGWALGVTALQFAIFFVAAQFFRHLAAIAFYLWTGAYSLLIVAEFWGLANERFTPRQAGRVFSIVGAGGILGGLAGGVLTVFGHWMGIRIEYLLLLAAALHLSVIPPTLRLRRSHGKPTAHPKGAEQSAQGGLNDLLHRPYIRLLVFLFLVGGTASAVLDYQFKLLIKQHYSTDSEISQFLGKFYVSQNILAILIQFGLTGLIISRVGARWASVAVPATFLCFGLATPFLPLFGLVLGLRLFESTMRVSVAGIAWEFLYFPLADGVRQPAKRFVDAVVNRSTEALAGLLLLGSGFLIQWNALELSALLGGLAVIWLVAEFKMNRVYRPELERTLEELLSGRKSQWRPGNEKLVEAELARSVEPAQRDQVIRAIKQIESSSPEGDRSAELVARLKDPDLEVCREAVKRAGRVAKREFIPILIELLARPEVRDVAQDALSLYGERVAGTLGDYLTDPAVDIQIRRAVPKVVATLGSQRGVDTLLRAGVPDDRHLADQLLKALTEIRSGNTKVTISASEVSTQVRAEADDVRRFLRYSCIAPVVPDPRARRLLDRVVAERTEHALDRIFRRLALIYPPRAMTLAHRGLQTGDRRGQAQSLWYLESALSPDDRSVVLPLIDDVTQTRVTRVAKSDLYARSHELIDILGEFAQRKADAWLCSCATFAIGIMRLSELRQQLLPALESVDPMLRKTAEWAVGRLDLESLTRVSPAEHQAPQSVMSVIDRTLLLMETEPLNRVSSEYLARLAARMTERHINTGHLIAQDPGDLYIVTEGGVELSLGESAIRRLHPRASFGLMATPRPGQHALTSARTLEPTRLMVLSREDFFDVLTELPETVEEVVEWLAKDSSA